MAEGVVVGQEDVAAVLEQLAHVGEAMLPVEPVAVLEPPEEDVAEGGEGWICTSRGSRSWSWKVGRHFPAYRGRSWWWRRCGATSSSSQLRRCDGFSDPHS